MLRRVKDERTLKENLLLASSTAFISGAVNVAGVVAFLAFTANITGHFANLARNVVERNFLQVLVFFIWVLLFFMGAFASNFLVRLRAHRSTYRANLTPILIEICILLFVAWYGNNFYNDGLTEKEVITGLIILATGLQNGLVSNISGGLIKTSHLTGLFTDLGSDMAELFFVKSKKTTLIKNRVYTRLTILGFYFLGGMAGGYFFDEYSFTVFYFIPLILMAILYYDISPIALHKLSRLFWRDNNVDN